MLTKRNGDLTFFGAVMAVVGFAVAVFVYYQVQVEWDEDANLKAKASMLISNAMTNATHCKAMPDMRLPGKEQCILYEASGKGGNVFWSNSLLPPALKFRGKPGPVTVFVLGEITSMQVGQYSISRSPANLTNMKVDVIHFSGSGDAQPVGELQFHEDPPKEREVRHAPEYADVIGGFSHWVAIQKGCDAVSR